MAAKTVRKKPTYIDESIVVRSLSHYDINPFYQFLVSIFGDKEATSLFTLYRVGTSKLWGGATVFWQTDFDGHVRSGKIMVYDPKTGHRIKTDGAKVCWAHVAMRLADFNLCQCFFGEHLLAQFPDRKVMIVESEKTAIICHHFMPEYVWLATGGKHGCFNSEAVHVLRERDVTLFPDLGAFDDWNSKVPLLRAVCHSVSVNDYLEKTANEEQRAQGLDIADFLLMTDTPQMILQRMIARNPVIQTLIDRLGLVLVEE